MPSDLPDKRTVVPLELTIKRGFFHSFHGMSSYATSLLGSAGWIRFTMGKGGGITEGGLLELQQQSIPNATGSIPETKRNMEHVHTESVKKRRCPDTSTDTGALEMFQLCEIRGRGE
jgi:hypothetical protein